MVPFVHHKSLTLLPTHRDRLSNITNNQAATNSNVKFHHYLCGSDKHSAPEAQIPSLRLSGF